MVFDEMEVKNYITELSVSKNLSSKTLKAYKEDLINFKVWLNENSIHDLNAKNIDV